VSLFSQQLASDERRANGDEIFVTKNKKRTVSRPVFHVVEAVAVAL
jgi:hypothetical protein